jgi:histone chaperone ASF1
MAAVQITSVNVLENPAPFASPLAFEVEYECLYDLKDDLEWKMIYVGSAESEKYDQQLDTVMVGPVMAGIYKFTFMADAPDTSKIPASDLVGVTAILLTCSYKEREFVRVGYYVNVEYTDEELRESPPEVPRVEQLTRSILADHPRVTKFPVPFDEEPAAEMGEGGAAQMEESAGGAQESAGGDAMMSQ